MQDWGRWSDVIRVRVIVYFTPFHLMVDVCPPGVLDTRPTLMKVNKRDSNHGIKSINMQQIKSL